MHQIRTIAVYCASSNRLNQAYFDEAYRWGKICAEQGINVVYGGGGIGLMGELARGVLDANGKIIGVIPQFMVDEGWNNPRSSETVIVQTMHERKAKIEQMADAMVALPGGIGTFEELLECMTWKQLGLHTKPIAILNVNGYFDSLLACLDKMKDEHFMRPVHRADMFSVVNHAEEVLPALINAPEWSQSIRRDAAI